MRQTGRALANLVARLASTADHAHSLRQFDVIDHVSRLMLDLPIPDSLENVGRYYQALSINQGGRGEMDRAASLFEQVADNAPLQYRARALLALGSMNLRVGDQQTAVSLYREVARMFAPGRVFDPMTFYAAQRMTAVIRSMDGDRRGALADLEKMFPLVRMASYLQPYAYYDYLNTVAVELIEAGRLEEAANASRIVLASPFASAYPEWRDTREEIQLRGYSTSRAMVGVSWKTSEAGNLVRRRLRAARSAPVADRAVSEKGNLVFLPSPPPDRGESAAPTESIPGDQGQLARVFNLVEHKKKKMPEEPNDAPKGKHTQSEMNNMTTSDLLVAIMNRISNDISDDALVRVLSLLDEIALENKEGS